MSERPAAFESVDYSLRPNKNIERKLIGEFLLAMSRGFPIRDYRYVGFGSLWFVDFILFHKLLGISDMVSIERADPHRAEFNRPFSCVEVRSGEASDVIREIGLDQRPVLLWLDFEDSIDGPAFADAAYAAETAAEGSIVLVTVNANIGNLKRILRKSGGRLRTEEEALRSCAPTLVPTPLDSKVLTSPIQFEDLVGTMLVNNMVDAARRSGREEAFVPLMNFAYKDGAPMVTVGGVVVHPQRRGKLEECYLDGIAWFCGSKLRQYRIAAPLLTAKEKTALDRHLPNEGQLSADSLFERTSLRLKQAQIDEYAKAYRHYPLFAELFR